MGRINKDKIRKGRNRVVKGQLYPIKSKKDANT